MIQRRVLFLVFLSLACTGNHTSRIDDQYMCGLKLGMLRAEAIKSMNQGKLDKEDEDWTVFEDVTLDGRKFETGLWFKNDRLANISHVDYSPLSARPFFDSLRNHISSGLGQPHILKLSEEQMLCVWRTSFADSSLVLISWIPSRARIDIFAKDAFRGDAW